MGVGGSGKKTLCSLAALISQSTFKTIDVQLKYGKKEFRQDLIDVLMKAGTQIGQVMFLLSDDQIIFES